MSSKYLELLRILARHEVEYMVIGGVAAVLAGAPITTLDLDILYARSPKNLDRLLASLKDLDASYRDPAERDIRPTQERLETLRIHPLLTNLGPLDLLSEIGDGWSYEDLLPDSRGRELGDLRVRILSLEKLIEAKEKAGREKDRLMLPILRRTLALEES